MHTRTPRRTNHAENNTGWFSLRLQTCCYGTGQNCQPFDSSASRVFASEAVFGEGVHRCAIGGVAMSKDERRGWRVIAALWVVMFLTIGSTISTILVFFNPLIHQFGWTHEQVSRLATAYILCMGIMAPVAGWMLDLVPAQVPMGTGVIAVAAGYLLASHAASLASLIAAFALIGAGVGSSSLVPGTIVAANWFKERRGLAIGIAVCGSAVGATIMPPTVAHLVIVYGWRNAMLCIGAPSVVIGLPAILTLVRTRPPGATVPGAGPRASVLPGLELGQALSALPFWMLAGVQILFTVAFNGVYYHLVPYLIGAGYSPQHAALIFGAKSIFVTVGTIIMGAMADRMGPRRVLAFGMLLLCVSLLDLFAVGNASLGIVAALLFIVGYGSPTGATSTTIPMLLGECLGMRRFATLMGIIGFIATVASALGPLATGLVFDMTGSYVLPFGLFAALFAAAAVIAIMVHPAAGHDQVPITDRAEATAIAFQTPGS
jgi:MFS family permease